MNALEKLKKYNQNHIIDLLQNFTEEEKEKLFEQVNRIDFNQIESLYNQLNAKEKETPDEIEEIVAINKDKLINNEIQRYNTIGENIIKDNQYALVTMSGGQGTRLGFDKPKGLFKIDIKPKPKYLFEILADKLKEKNNQYNITIPWYIMTSEENDSDIKEFFENNNYFNYPKSCVQFFKQSNLPLITEDKKLVIGKNKLIKEAANGNGGIFSSMYSNNILDDMKERKIRWIFISSIDNILLNIADPILIGLAEDRRVEIATKSIIKSSPEEKVGAICKKDNKIKVIEYSEMSEEMKNAHNEEAELKFGESHIMCNLFSLNALETLAKKELPYHIAYKKSDYMDVNGNIIHPDTPNVYKFESFIFDGWSYFNDIVVLRGKREEDFAPIKNKEGQDSPQTAIALYNNFYDKEIKKL